MSTDTPDGTHMHTNRLAGETSPYLLQHAHNPVDWFPWGPEALARARELDRPIFLSVGYAACHWCHVMERESFEDEQTARELNATFIPVKVDREERPDIDAVYMDAVQQMTGQGGWPMSVFLTPDGRPFYAGTYFPNRRGMGLPAFRDVIHALADAWQTRRDQLETSATELAAAVAQGQRAPGAVPANVLGIDGEQADGERVALEAVLDAATAALRDSFDFSGGGWGRAPKFPQAGAIEFLLREHVRTGAADALSVARRSLDAMADGGIHDQIGGGFARYSTDAMWLVPHFEKMLYDNAQLARAYTHAFQLTRDPRSADVARDTLDFMRRDLGTAEGAFAASLDADTDGHEGATYVWDAAEVEAVLGEEAELFSTAYGVTAGGNWECRTILSRVVVDEDLAHERGLQPDEVAARLAHARRTLFEARQKRAQPSRDDKVIASWNGLAIAALADASWALDRPHPEYAEAAKTAADFLLTSLRDDAGRLARSWNRGRARDAGTLEDHAHLADGLLALYRATFEERWFTAALQLVDLIVEHFRDTAGTGFFDTADDAESLIARPRGLQDSPVPSGGAAAVTVLLEVGALTGESRYTAEARAAAVPMAPVAARYPSAFAQWLIGFQTLSHGLLEIALVDGRRSAADELVAVTRRAFRPWQVVARGAEETQSAIPLLLDRVPRDGEATAYVCRGFTCRQPVVTAEALEREVVEAEAAAGAAWPSSAST